jgi:shikimate dehydrogenase
LPDEPDDIDRYGVVGYPVSHSRSPVIHQLFAHQTGHRIRYELLEVAPEKLEQAVRQFQRTGGRGLNVTLPHKSAVAALCDQLSERAEQAGAVNTLAFQDGEIFGDNTDGIGLTRDLESNIGYPLRDRRILVLGAGGATLGIVGPLLARNPASLVVANRTLARAESVVERFGHPDTLAACAFDAIPGDGPFDLVINATSAGLKGETPPYPAAAVGRQTLCYDLSYGSRATPFAAWARGQHAAASIMGWGMLVEQAAEAFHLWRGVRPDTAPVLKQVSVSA